MKTVFQTSDGKIFEQHALAYDHEQELNNKKRDPEYVTFEGKTYVPFNVYYTLLLNYESLKTDVEKRK